MGQEFWVAFFGFLAAVIGLLAVVLGKRKTHEVVIRRAKNHDLGHVAVADLVLETEIPQSDVPVITNETRPGSGSTQTKERTQKEQKTLPTTNRTEPPERVLSSVPAWYGTDLIRGGSRGELKLTSGRLLFIDRDKRLLLDMNYELLNGCHIYGEKQWEYMDGPESYYYFLVMSGIDQSHMLRFDATCYSRLSGESVPVAIQKFIAVLQNIISAPFEWRRRT